MAAFIGCALPAAAANGTIDHHALAIDTYHKAWSEIKTHYLDKTCNGQNWARWEHRYDAKLNNEADCEKAIETMAQSLGDVRTRYLPSSVFDDERMQIIFRFGGVGMHLGTDKNGRSRVIAPIRNTPAQNAGIAANDIIVAVDGRSTGGMEISEVAKRIRGPIGTPVTLTLRHNSAIKQYKLIRNDIPVRDVSAAMMMAGFIGYVRLDTLISISTMDEVNKELTRLKKARGFIIDVRHNPAGLLANGIDLARLFVNDGVIVSMVDRNGEMQREVAGHRAIYKQPVVILIDEGTASSAAIFAAALRDNKRAILVGRHSFAGRGTVQSIFRLPDGSGINLTVARYLSPLNKNLDDGIGPDVDVAPHKCMSDYTHDGQLAKAIQVLASMLRS